jgi:hypothetical protein
MMALHRSRKILRYHDEKPGDENARGGSGGTRLGFAVRHRASDLTGPAANALFSIALDKRTELFRSQFHAPNNRIDGPLCFSCADFLRN